MLTQSFEVSHKNIMAQKDSQIQQYSPEVRQATADIVQQLPADVNSLALQAKIAEAIVQRSEERILKAINEALAYRPSPAPATPARVDNSVKIGDINIKVDCSQTTNYWVDASQSYTDNSQHNYWQDNSQRSWTDSRQYTDNSDNSDNSSAQIFGFDLSSIGLVALLLMALAIAFSQPCGQQFQQQRQQQEFQGGAGL